MTIPTPEDALRTLLAGNDRFTASQFLRPHQSSARRVEVALGQAPFAAVLGCSDSRLPPEVVLDCGLGDLFTIRTAGHSLGSTVLGSLEYAAIHLKVALILVLGHERCGVVRAYFEADQKTGQTAVRPAPGPLRALVDGLAPAVEAARARPGDLVEATVREHIRRTVESIRTQVPRVQALIDQKRLGLVGARYDLDDGHVQCVCAHGMEVPKEKWLDA